MRVLKGRLPAVVMLACALGCGDTRSPGERIAEVQTAAVLDLLERVGPPEGAETVCLFEAATWTGAEGGLAMPGRLVPPSDRLVEVLEGAGIATTDGSACGSGSFRIFVGQPEEGVADDYEVPVLWRAGLGGGTERCAIRSRSSSRRMVDCTGDLEF